MVLLKGSMHAKQSSTLLRLCVYVCVRVYTCNSTVRRAQAVQSVSVFECVCVCAPAIAYFDDLMCFTYHMHSALLIRSPRRLMHSFSHLTLTLVFLDNSAQTLYEHFTIMNRMKRRNVSEWASERTNEREHMYILELLLIHKSNPIFGAQTHTRTTFSSLRCFSFYKCAKCACHFFYLMLIFG